MPKKLVVKVFLALFLLMLGIGFIVGTIKFGWASGVLMLLAIVAIPVIYFLIVSPHFGILTYLSLAYTIMWFSKFTNDFPVGILMDGMLVFFVLGFFIKQKSNSNWTVFKNPISIVILFWILYNIGQVLNPVAESKMAWLYTIRTVAIIALMYYIFLYHIRTKQFVKTILKWWLLASLFNAIYALKQEYIGFFYFEQHYLDTNPIIAELLFQGGHWRKFSINPDPVTFAFNMVMASILCFALMTGPLKTYRKFILGILAVLFFYVMLFSGTRSAYPLIPAALLFMTLLKFNKQVLAFSGIGLIIISFLIFVPTTNDTISRFQSAFRPNNDPSYQVRLANQARIKPYMYSHPFGGGLGATGTWGRQFSPNSYLANFPPDSGYVRVTVELGWIGLIIFCGMIFVILQFGLSIYFKIRDPELKSYALAMILIIFAWNIGNYPQEALVQYPSNVLFYLAIAIMPAIYKIDQQQNLAIDAQH
jgi:O-antigen ligase